MKLNALTMLLLGASVVAAEVTSCTKTCVAAAFHKAQKRNELKICDISMYADAVADCIEGERCADAPKYVNSWKSLCEDAMERGGDIFLQEAADAKAAAEKQDAAQSQATEAEKPAEPVNDNSLTSTSNDANAGKSEPPKEAEKPAESKSSNAAMIAGSVAVSLLVSVMQLI